MSFGSQKSFRIMNYKLDHNKFYITLDGIDSPVGNLQEEANKIARKISAISNKIMLSISSGIDSQVMLHSFVSQNLPYECAFLYSPGYNDTEFQQLKILENKYGFTTTIVELDPIKLKDEIIHESTTYKIQRNQIYQKKYLSILGEEYHFVQMLHSDFTFIKNGQSYFQQGYNSDVVSRDRAFKLLNRKGSHTFFGEDSRYLYSMLSDDIYKVAMISDKYFNNNLNGYNRYDNYIKPLMYAKYWGEELEYFPKLTGLENLNYLSDIGWWHEHNVYIPLEKMLENMRLNISVEYLENYHKIT